MANNWQPPSASSAGWVPSGKGLRAFMGGLVKGTAAWRGRKDEYAAQQLAVQQYEEEKEYKRKQDEYKRTQDQINAAMEARRVEQEAIATQANLKYEYELKTAFEQSKELGKERETKQEKWQTELDKHLTKLDKLETDFAQRRADEIRQAIEAGDVGKLVEIHKQVLQNADLMRTYKRKTTTKEGKPTEVIETSNDINDLQGALYFITRLMKQKYGESAMQAERPTAMRNSVEFRADRARLISLLKAGRENDARAKLIEMRKYNMTEEEVNAIEKEAGVGIQ